MKKFISLALIALVLTVMVGCGTKDGSEIEPIDNLPSDSIADSAEPEITDDSTTELELAQYPSEKSRKLQPWEDETPEGFVIETQITVWDPMKLEEEYSPHPGDGAYKMWKPYEDRDIWVIPFTWTLTNKTVGFGSVKFENWIGIANLTPNPRGAAYPSDNSTISEITLKPHSYSWTVCPIGPGEQIFEGANYAVVPFDLAEGASRTICGYTRFVDEVRIPNKPNGVENDDGIFWDPDAESGMIFGGGMVHSERGVMIKPLLALRKNDVGDLSFCEEFK